MEFPGPESTVLRKFSFSGEKMPKFKVPITDYVPFPAVFEQTVLGDIADVPCLEQTDESGLAGKIDDADALIVFHTIRISASSIGRLNNCRAIVRCGVGYDNVDLAAAGAKGIYVCNVPDYGTDEVADHALALMLACARGLAFTERGLRKTLAPWNFLAASPLQRLAGATLGIIGLGRIGTATALRAKGFRMKVVASDPYLPDGYDKALGVAMLSLDELLSVSDIVSVHTPLTPETTNIVGAPQLAKMKPHAVLINTARGKCVDVQAVAAALKAEKIGGAGLDVLPDEPPAHDDPIVRLWQQENPPVNLILTPHNAFYTEQSREEMRTKAAHEVRRVLMGQKPRNAVNREFLPKDF